jgi:hypothetical protein
MAGLEDHIRDLCAGLLDRGTATAASTSSWTSARCCRPWSSASCSACPAADRAWVKEMIDTTFHIEPDVGMLNDVSLTPASSSTAT